MSDDPPIKTVQAWFRVYRSKEAADAGRPPIDQIHIYADATTDPSYDQVAADQAATAASVADLAYRFLRLRPDFAGAEDA